MVSSFFNMYHHNFVRIAVAIPQLQVADPAHNAQQVIEMIRHAAQHKAAIILFPELNLSAYTCEDLFHQRALLEGCIEHLQRLLQQTADLPIISVIGTPLQVDHLLFNCAAVFSGGSLLGIVPKTYLPNYREFYEGRQFCSADAATTDEVSLCGQDHIPYGNNLIFTIKDQPLCSFYIELCEDVWVPIPPSCYAALAGATVLLNLSASNITVGKAQYRHQLVSNQSARCLAAYAYSAAGTGESTTDLAWDGHAMIYENGQLLSESNRFSEEAQIICADVDLDRLTQERMRQTSFSQSIIRHKQQLQTYKKVICDISLPQDDYLPLDRAYERFPYVPSSSSERDIRCYESYQIQVQALIKRLSATKIKRAVLGISGGLDSTQALIVTAKAFDQLGYSREQILAYTMPGFATSERTLTQAHRLMKALGCSSHQIDIRPSCMQMLEDIDHPYSRGEAIYDITFENVQAGERTSHLFRLANMHDAIVIGTGDLSELALGWCTYGVGDHMSHYNVNASIPKTLIQHLIRWVTYSKQFGDEVSEVLCDILGTEISPELVPSQGEYQLQPSQRTEDVIGPYELQDFHLYYTLRYGYSPVKIAFLAYHTWADRNRGIWPKDIPVSKRNQYDLASIKQHLGTFLYRFFEISQFKRSCVPNAPKVGSGGSLSPRGDYRAPSDSKANIWLAQITNIPDQSPDPK